MSQVFLRSPQIASRAYGTNTPGQYMLSIPRVNFEFYVQFNLSAGAIKMIPNAQLSYYGTQRGITFKVKTVEKPKVTLVSDELNQYNKKVIIYKKTEYQPASISLYDSVDDSVLSTWVDYFTYYFADSRQKTDAAYLQSPVASQFDLSSGWGFNPLLDGQTNFFDDICVYALFAGTYTAFSYINPKIVSIDWGSSDYTSNEPQEVSMQIKYEAINYFAFGQPISSLPAGVMPNFGFEIPQDGVNYPVGTVNTPNTAVPRIFNNSTGNNDGSPSSPQSTVSKSSNISNPTTAPVQTSNKKTTGTSASAPGATTPIPITTASTVNQNINFGQQGNTPADFTAQTIQQQIAQQSGQIAITQFGGGFQYTNTLNGQVLNLPPVSSVLLNTPIQSNNPIISAQALALSQGYYGPSVPQALVQSIASVAAYISATNGIPVSLLLSPSGVTTEFLTGYNSIAPIGSSIGIASVNLNPVWTANPTLRGSLSAAIDG